MTANAAAIVAPISAALQGVVASVTGPDAGQATAQTVALTLCRRVLALGGLLRRVCVLPRATARPAAPSPSGAGLPLPYHDRRPVPDDAVCGTRRCARHHGTAAGRGGACPRAAALRRPPRGAADRRRAWLRAASTARACRDRQTAVARVLGQTVNVQAIATATADAAQDVAACSTPPPVPVVAPAAPLLVVPAAGPGVPPRPPPAAPPTPARLGTGQQRTTTQDAVVPRRERSAPDPRTPAAVVVAVLRARDDQAAAAPRPTPVRQAGRATLAGTAAALTDGAAARHQPVQAQCPAATLVRASSPATAYRGAAATALLGARPPQRTPWVRGQRRALRAGQTAPVIGAVPPAADAPPWPAGQRAVRVRVGGAYRRTAPARRDHADCAQGWPSGTGVGAGACGHLVKGRRDQRGRRWTRAGAHAVRALRAVRRNGDRDPSWACHRQRHQQRRSGVTGPCPPPAEQQVAAWAA